MIRVGTICVPSGVDAPHSGVRVIEVNAQEMHRGTLVPGIRLQRIHPAYANDPEREYFLKQDVFDNSGWAPAPVGSQLPLL